VTVAQDSRNRVSWPLWVFHPTVLSVLPVLPVLSTVAVAQDSRQRVWWPLWVFHPTVLSPPCPSYDRGRTGSSPTCLMALVGISSDRPFSPPCPSHGRGHTKLSPPCLMTCGDDFSTKVSMRSCSGSLDVSRASCLLSFVFCISEVWGGGRPLRSSHHPTHTSCEVWWGLVRGKNLQKHEGNEPFACLDAHFLVHFEGSMRTFWSILRGPYALFGPYFLLG
jgi:hypothetical protein